MKKYGMLALAFGFIFSLALSAQDQMPPKGQGERGPRPEMRQGGDRAQMTPQVRAQRMAKQLDLTADQQAQVQALYEKQNAEHQKKQAEVKTTGEDMKAKFEAERKTNDEELAKILGSEKFQKWQSLLAERQQKMKERKEAQENHSSENNGENK